MLERVCEWRRASKGRSWKGRRYLPEFHLVKLLDVADELVERVSTPKVPVVAGMTTLKSFSVVPL